MSGWRKNKKSWAKIYHRQKRMKKWISKHGQPCEVDEETQKDEWRSQNTITICPPFGHNPKGD